MSASFIKHWFCKLIKPGWLSLQLRFIKHLERLARFLTRPAQAGMPAQPLGVHTCCLTLLAATKKSSREPCLGFPGRVCMSQGDAHFLGPVLGPRFGCRAVEGAGSFEMWSCGPHHSWWHQLCAFFHVEGRSRNLRVAFLPLKKDS